MGNPKQKWTAEEEEALRAGVAKYGPGKWKFIQKDPEFNQFLHSRSNIDLKVLPFSLSFSPPTLVFPLFLIRVSSLLYLPTIDHGVIWDQ